MVVCGGWGGGVVRIPEIYSLNKFQVNNTLLLTTVTMLYIGSRDLTFN